jgi:hypothetical protein
MKKKLIVIDENNRITKSGTNDSIIGIKDPTAEEIGLTPDRHWKINKDFDEYNEDNQLIKKGKREINEYGNCNYEKLGDEIIERDTTVEDTAATTTSNNEKTRSKLPSYVVDIIDSMPATQRSKIPTRTKDKYDAIKAL